MVSYDNNAATDRKDYVQPPRSWVALSALHWHARC